MSRTVLQPFGSPLRRTVTAFLVVLLVVLIALGGYFLNAVDSGSSSKNLVLITPADTMVFSFSGQMNKIYNANWPTVLNVQDYALYKDGVLVATAGPNAIAAKFSFVNGQHTVAVWAQYAGLPITTTVATTTAPTTTVATTTPTTTPTPIGGANLTALYTIEDSWKPGGTTVTVSTPAQLQSQASNPTASEVIVTAGTYPGTFNFSAKPTSTVKYLFQFGVKFTGSSATCGSSCTIAALYITGSNLILWGPADVSNPNWDSIRVDGASNSVIGGGMKVHDSGLQGIIVATNSVGGPTNFWLDGVEAYSNGTAQGGANAGGSWASCTGGATAPNCDYWKAGTHDLYWGNDTAGGGVVNSYFHDQLSGYCVEIENDSPTDNAIFAFNTLTRCESQSDGFHDNGHAFYGYTSGSNIKIVGNVIDGSALAGVAWCHMGGVGQGNVFWNVPADTSSQCGDSSFVVSGSHDLDPQLLANDRPGVSSPLKNLASTYLAYLPRTDFSGAARVTADPGAFVAP